MTTPECLFHDEHTSIYVGDSLDPEVVATILPATTYDLLLVDAPFSERTHAGYAEGHSTKAKTEAFARRASTRGRARERAYAGRLAVGGDGSRRRPIDYEAWTSENVDDFCHRWLPACTGWTVAITDDVLAPDWDTSFGTDDWGLKTRLVFPPLPLVETGSRVRLSGDGPSSWTSWVVAGRPKTKFYAKWGTLPGAYVVPAERKAVVGGKPLMAMLGLVRDYSRAGQLVVDPCCGAGTTLVAARMLGRRGIGVEKDRERARLAAARVSRTTYQQTLDLGLCPRFDAQLAIDLNVQDPS